MAKNINVILTLQDRYSKKMSDAAYQTFLFNQKLGLAQGLSSKFASAMHVMEGSAVAGTAAMIGLGKTTLDSYREFNDVMNNVAGVQNIKTASAEYKKLTETAKEAAKAIKGTTYTQAAGAEYYMGLAGWSNSEIEAGLKPILKAIRVSGEDAKTVSDAITDSMTALGLNAKDADWYVDTATAVQSAANTTMLELQNSMIKGAPQFMNLYRDITEGSKEARKSLTEDVMAMTGLLANAGVKDTAAGTSINTLIGRFFKESGEADAALRSIGMTMYGGDGSTLPIVDIVTGLYDKLKDLSDKERNPILTAIGGARGGTALGDLINGMEKLEESGVSSWEKIKEAIGESEGAAERYIEAVNSGYGGEVALLAADWENFKVDVGEEIAPYAIEFLQTIRGDLPEIQAWIGEKIPTAGEKFLAFLNKAKDLVGWIAEHGKTILEAAGLSYGAMGLFRLGTGAFSTANTVSKFFKTMEQAKAANEAWNLAKSGITLLSAPVDDIVDSDISFRGKAAGWGSATVSDITAAIVKSWVGAEKDVNIGIPKGTQLSLFDYAAGAEKDVNIGIPKGTQLSLFDYAAGADFGGNMLVNGMTNSAEGTVYSIGGNVAKELSGEAAGISSGITFGEEVAGWGGTLSAGAAGTGSAIGSLAPILGIGAAVAVGGAAIYGIYKYSKYLQEVDLEKRFGDIELSARDCRDMVDSMFGSETLTRIRNVNESYEDFDNALNNTESSADVIRKIEFKLEYGGEGSVNKEDYINAVEDYSADIQTAIDELHTTFNVSYELLFKDAETDYKNSGDTYFNQLTERANEITEKYKGAIEEAFENGFDDTAKTVVEDYKQQLAEINREIAEYNAEVQRNKAAFEFGNSDLSEESFQRLVDETTSTTEEAKEAYYTSQAVEKTQLEKRFENGEINKAAYKKELDRINEETYKGLAEIETESYNFLMEQLNEAFPELGEAEGNFQKKLEQKQKQIMKEAAAYGTSVDPEIALRAAYNSLRPEDFFNDTATLKNFKKFTKKIEPIMNEMSFLYGKIDPEDISPTFAEGLKSTSMVKTLTGVGEDVVKQPYEEMKGFIESHSAEVGQAAAKLGEQVADGLNESTIEVQTAVARMNSVISGVKINIPVTFGKPKTSDLGEQWGIGPKKNALGTTYFSGGKTQINEQGGEIVDLPTGTRIIPADKSKKIAERSGGKSFVINVNIGNMYGRDDEFIEYVGERVAHKLASVM